MKKIFLIVLGLSSILWADFSRSGKTVIDNITKLQWEDHGGMRSSIEWMAAIQHCDDLDLDGKQDWRVPNFNELSLLVDSNRTDPAIDSTFKHLPTTEVDRNFFYIYWSSTTALNDRDHAWIVDFRYGLTDDKYKKTEDEWVIRDGVGNGAKGDCFLRCVRGGI